MLTVSKFVLNSKKRSSCSILTVYIGAQSVSYIIYNQDTGSSKYQLSQVIVNASVDYLYVFAIHAKRFKGLDKNRRFWN